MNTYTQGNKEEHKTCISTQHTSTNGHRGSAAGKTCPEQGLMRRKEAGAWGSAVCNFWMFLGVCFVIMLLFDCVFCVFVFFGG